MEGHTADQFHFEDGLTLWLFLLSFCCVRVRGVRGRKLVCVCVSVWVFDEQADVMMF